VKDWEIIADNLSKAGWSWGWVSALDPERANDLDCGRSSRRKRFVVLADEKLTAFAELESAIRKNCLDTIGRRLTQPEKTIPPSAFA